MGCGDAVNSMSHFLAEDDILWDLSMIILIMNIDGDEYLKP